MRSFGITSLIVGNGKSTINGMGIEGKGGVGLVFRARIGRRICAVKIRRTDADRNAMDAEAGFQARANAAGVGPRIEGHSKNLIVMEFADGQSIVDWIRSASARTVRSVTRSVLQQCYGLDTIGLDHGELSRLHRHVIVTGRSKPDPFIIDFESASMTRKTANVTSACQALFLYGSVASHVRKILGDPDTDNVIGALREYKKWRTNPSFGRLLNLLPI
jgi:putative serine/threonine protein kinase